MAGVFTGIFWRAFVGGRLVAGVCWRELDAFLRLLLAFCSLRTFVGGFIDGRLLAGVFCVLLAGVFAFF